MSLKCPACGFDSADGAQWCDFCKQPFRKKAPPAPPKDPLAGADALKLTPAQMALLDDGAKMPTLPPWFRSAAWSLLVVVLLWAAGLAWVVVTRQQARRDVEATAPPAHFVPPSDPQAQ